METEPTRPTRVYGPSSDNYCPELLSQSLGELFKAFGWSATPKRVVFRPNRDFIL